MPKKYPLRPPAASPARMDGRLTFSGWILILISAISGGCTTPLPLSVPENADFLLAEESFHKANHRTAIIHYQRFLAAERQSPYRADAYYRTGQCYLAEGEYDQALKSLLQARTSVTDKLLKTHLMATIAQTYMCLKNYPEAVRYYKQALSIGREDLKTDEILFYLGIALMRLSADLSNGKAGEVDSGKWQEGRARLRELIKTMPQSSFAAPAEERLALPSHTFVVQLGKYRHKNNALNELGRFKYDKDIQATLKPLRIKGEQFYFIWAKGFTNWTSAQKKAGEFQDKGVEAIVLP